MWQRVLALFDPRRKLRLDLQQTKSQLAVTAAERAAYLQQRDDALGERNELQRQRDIALGERNELLGQRDIALGERNELQRQHDVVLGERNELQRQRDVAIGERNEILRQRDLAIGENNLRTEHLARRIHRADMTARRGMSAPQAGHSRPALFPLAASRDRILLYLHLAKTGGLTLADILARNFSSGDYLILDETHVNTSVLGTWSNLDVERALGKMRSGEIDRIRAVCGCFRHGVHETLRKPCAYVTLLRDPVDRIVSAYYDTHRQGQEPEETLAIYLGRKRHDDLGLDNYMTRVLSGLPALDPIAPGSTTANCPRPTDADFELAAKNLDGCLLVGLAERFDEMLLILAADLCWSLCDLVYTPVTATTSRPAVGDVPTSIRDRVLDWNRYDAALVERARVLLERRIQAYLGDFQRDLALFRKLNALFREGASMEELRRMECDGLA